MKIKAFVKTASLFYFLLIFVDVSATYKLDCVVLILEEKAKIERGNKLGQNWVLRNGYYAFQIVLPAEVHVDVGHKAVILEAFNSLFGLKTWHRNKHALELLDLPQDLSCRPLINILPDDFIRIDQLLRLKHIIHKHIVIFNHLHPPLSRSLTLQLL